MRYDGRRFRRRFRRRLALREALEIGRDNTVLTVAVGILRTPPGRRLAEDVFFGRGSFPDIETRWL